MAVTISNSPVHSDCIITYPYGVADSGYSCGWHTGVDFAPYGTTSSNPPLYSVCSGTVVRVTYDGTLGNQVQIQDSVTGNYWRYCHMQSASTLSVGDSVTTNTQVGIMGATGNATGIHLHLEYSTTQAWQCSTFLNPCTALGIPNVDNTVIHYNGVIPPTPPTPTIEKKKFPWVIYANKIRKRY